MIIKHKRDLPNDVGFKFIAVYNDGREVVQEVKKDENGKYYIDNFSDIRGWLNYNGTRRENAWVWWKDLSGSEQQELLIKHNIICETGRQIENIYNKEIEKEENFSWLLNRILETSKEYSEEKNYEIKIFKGGKLTAYKECLEYFRNHL
jgi:hypothetical protein